MAAQQQQGAHTVYTAQSALHGNVRCVVSNDPNCEWPIEEMVLYQGAVTVRNAKLITSVVSKKKTPFDQLVAFSMTEHVAAAIGGRECTDARVTPPLLQLVTSGANTYALATSRGIVLALDPHFDLTSGTHMSENLMLTRGRTEDLSDEALELLGTADRCQHAFPSLTAFEMSVTMERWAAKNRDENAKRTKSEAPPLSDAEWARLRCADHFAYKGLKMLKDMEIKFGARSGPDYQNEIKPDADGSVTAENVSEYKELVKACRAENPRKKAGKKRSASSISAATQVSASSSSSTALAPTSEEILKVPVSAIRALLCRDVFEEDALCALNPDLARMLGMTPMDPSLVVPTPPVSTVLAPPPPPMAVPPISPIAAFDLSQFMQMAANPPSLQHEIVDTSKKIDPLTPEDLGHSNFDAFAAANQAAPIVLAPATKFSFNFEAMPPPMMVSFDPTRIINVVPQSNSSQAVDAPRPKRARTSTVPANDSIITVMQPRLHEVTPLSDEVLDKMGAFPLGTYPRRLNVLLENQDLLFSRDEPVYFKLRVPDIDLHVAERLEQGTLAMSRFVEHAVGIICTLVSVQGDLSQMIFDCTWDNIETEAAIYAAMQCGYKRAQIQAQLSRCGNFTQLREYPDLDDIPFPE